MVMMSVTFGGPGKLAPPADKLRVTAPDSPAVPWIAIAIAEKALTWSLELAN